MKVASQPGVRSIHAFSGETIGLNLQEAMVRVTGSDLDRGLLLMCFTAFERGFMTGKAKAKDGETQNDR